MEDQNKERILYTPDIEPERHYESKGTFPESTTPSTTPSTDTDIPDQRQEIIDDLDELIDMVDFLPDQLHFISGTIDKLAKRERVIQYEEHPPENCVLPTDCETDCEVVNCAINDCESDCDYPNDCNCINDCEPGPLPTNCVHYDNDPDKNCESNCGSDLNPSTNCTPIDAINCNCTDDNWQPSPIAQCDEDGWEDCTPGISKDTDTTDTKEKNVPDINYFPEEDPGETVDLPNLFPEPTKIKIELVEPRTLVDIARGNYKEDTINLHEYYIQRLQTVLQHYFQQMIMVMQDAGVSDLSALTQDFDGSKVVIKNSNLSHLRDHIVRSQIQRDQKARLLQKTHNVDNTLTHMRAWQAAEKERERYYTEQYIDSGTFLDSANNEILRKSRSSYDTAYSQALYDMYKYLNSSVVGIGDVLDLTLEEAKAKGKLLKEGVDIYASRKKEINEARQKQIKEAEAAHETAVAKAKESKQINQNGKAIDSSSGRNQHEQDLFKDDTGAALTGNVSNGSDDSKSTDSSSSSSSQASDEQYQNDLKYLESKGYTKEAADAELAKLPQYADRFKKQTNEAAKDAKQDSAKQNEGKTAPTQSDYDAFAKEKAEHPEWFVGDTYVGDDADARAKAEEAAKAAVQKVTDKKKKKNFWQQLSDVFAAPSADKVIKDMKQNGSLTVGGGIAGDQKK